MTFALKKLVGWCLSPIGLPILLLGVGLALSCTKRRRRVAQGLLGAALALLLLFSAGPVADALSRPLERRYAALDASSPLEGVAAVAVLGAGYEAEAGKPATAWLQAPGLARLVEGLRVLRVSPGARLVVSGWGAGRRESTAAVMERAAASLGADPARIVRFDAPRDTAEELAALHALVGARKVVIVTSAMHLPRAMELAAAEGLDAIPAPVTVAYGAASGGARAWVPSEVALARSSSAVHEWLGRAWAWLSGKLQGGPSAAADGTVGDRAAVP